MLPTKVSAPKPTKIEIVKGVLNASPIHNVNINYPMRVVKG